MTALGDLHSLLQQQTHQGLADLEAHCDKLMLMVLEHTGKPQCKAVSSCRHGCHLYRSSTSWLASSIAEQTCASSCQPKALVLSACTQRDSTVVELGLAWDMPGKAPPEPPVRTC